MTDSATNFYYATLRREAAKRVARNARQHELQALREGREYRPHPKTLEQLRRGLRRFDGADGEGGGTDANGAQLFRLFRIGDRLLFEDNRPLGTVDCFEFILAHPARPIIVGFAFGYDSTMILRDMEPEYVARLFEEPDEDQPSRYVHWRGYAVDYLSGQYLRVARLYDVPAEDAKGRKVWIVPGSTRTIWECWGFFQASFVRALEAWDIGDKAEREKIEAVKKRRAGFGKMTPELVAYNAAECKWLAQLMEKFRDTCHAAGIRPRTWNGAGKLAHALMKEAQVMRRETVESITPPEVLKMAKHAYYGGRAELGRPGPTEGAVHAYDRRSAYPSAMLDLPCLECAQWQKLEPEDWCWLTENDLFVGDVNFTHPKDTLWCGLPWRQTGLRWPLAGRGAYWSVELFAAQRLGARLNFRGGWLLKRNCDHKPFEFIRDVYARRRELDNIAKNRGTPLKVATNSVYGKLAQRIGHPPFQNPIWAGLITASVRASMIDAILSAPSPASIIAIATDAIFSVDPLPLDIGGELGYWEDHEHPRMFFALPGIYWEIDGDHDRLAKTRGMRREDLVSNCQRLEEDYSRFASGITGSTEFQLMGRYPRIEFPVPGFVGLRLAHARGAPETAGKWTAGKEATRVLNMDWSSKRQGRHVVAVYPGGGVQTIPMFGNANAISKSWEVVSPKVKLEQDWERWEAEGQPDHDDDPVLSLLLDLPLAPRR